jgi:hypothetical protein
MVFASATSVPIGFYRFVYYAFSGKEKWSLPRTIFGGYTASIRGRLNI